MRVLCAAYWIIYKANLLFQTNYYYYYTPSEFFTPALVHDLSLESE